MDGPADGTNGIGGGVGFAQVTAYCDESGDDQRGDAEQHQAALNGISINHSKVSAKGYIDKHNDAKQYNSCLVINSGDHIEQQAGSLELGNHERYGEDEQDESGDQTGGAAFKAFFQKIRDSEKIEITGAGTEFAPQQPPA